MKSEILAGLVLLIGACATSYSQEPAKPNIVLIMAEDIGNDLACYGHAGVKTPTLDALAARGIRYERFYTNSPICSPSRTSMMLGMYQTSCGGMHHRSDVDPKDPRWKYMTDYLEEAGYTCVRGSKLVYEGGRKLDVNIDRRGDHLTTMDAYKGDPFKEPFFHQIQLKVTHRDHNSDRWKALRQSSKNPVNVDEVEVPPYLPDVPEVRDDWATYLDQIEEADRQTQLVLDDLKKRGVLDNTIMIWIGDNGRCQIRGKGYLFEDGIRCPLIIAGKAIDQGKVVDDLVSGIDLTATILALAGIEQPAHMQGQAFLNNPSYTPKDYVFAARDIWDEVKDCSRTIVGKRFKYIYNFMPEVPFDAGQKYLNHQRVRPILPVLRRMNKDGALTPEQAYFFRPKKDVEQLYDLENDPFELNNLANDPELQEKKEALKKRLFAWIEETRDMGLNKSPDGTWTTTLDDWGGNRMWKKKASGSTKKNGKDK